MSTMILRAEVIFRDPPNSALEAVEQVEKCLNLAPPPSGLDTPPPSITDLIEAQHPNQVYALGIVQTQSASSFASFKGYTNRVQVDLAAPLVATDTISLGPVTLEWVVLAANENEITIGGTSDDCATNLAAVINAHSILSVFFSASATTDTVTVTFAGVGAEAQLIVMNASNVTGNIILTPGFTPERIGEIATVIGNPVFTIASGYDAFAWESLAGGEEIDVIDPATMSSRFTAGPVLVDSVDTSTDSVTLSGDAGDLLAIQIGDIVAPVVGFVLDQSFLSYGGRS